MRKNKINNFTNILGRMILLAIIILFLFNIGRSIYNNHKVKTQILDLEKEIAILENEKIYLENRILYYQTDTYKELEARAHLGYKKKGEKVISLISTDQGTSFDQFHNFQEDETNTQNDQTPNWQKWIKYIFG